LANESERWRFPFPSPSPKKSPLPGQRRNKMDRLVHPLTTEVGHQIGVHDGDTPSPPVYTHDSLMLFELQARIYAIDYTFHLLTHAEFGRLEVLYGPCWRVLGHDAGDGLGLVQLYSRCQGIEARGKWATLLRGRFRPW
jgi:hypothetical protein